MKDFHCHILPGLDDGARTLDEALDIARGFVTLGFREVYCTPHHIKGMFNNPPERVREAVADFQGELDRQGIVLKLHAGTEYYLDEFFPDLLDDPITLGDTKILLVEAPGQPNADLIQDNIFYAVRKGFTPLIAHPERCALFDLQLPRTGLGAKVVRLIKRGEGDDVKMSSLLQSLQEMGCLFQGNLGSLSGVYGRHVAEKAHRFLNAGLYSHWGSDAHRARGMDDVLSKALSIVQSKGAQ